MRLTNWVTLSSALIAFGCGDSESNGTSVSGGDDAGAGNGSTNSGSNSGENGGVIFGPTDGGTTGTLSGGVNGADGSCGGELLEAAPKPVSILLVIDKSKSMDSTPTGFDVSKWAALEQALDEVLTDNQDKASFGVELFPRGVDEADGCAMPAADSAVEVDIAPGATSVPDILELVVDTVEPSGSTPTARALEIANYYFTQGAGVDAAGERFVMLATDGGPNCNDALTCDMATCTTNIDNNVNNMNLCDSNVVPGAHLGCLDDDGANGQVVALAGAGVRTIVIGFPGSESYADTLGQLAISGQFENPAPPPRYFEVSAMGGVEGLKTVLGEITTNLIRSCNIELEAEPPDRNKVNVTVFDEIVPQGADGWDYVENSSPPIIELLGTTCDRVKAEGTETISVIFSCRDTVRIR